MRRSPTAIYPLVALLAWGCEDGGSSSPVDAARDRAVGDAPRSDASVPDAAVDQRADQQADHRAISDLQTLPDLGPLGDDFALIVPFGSEACAIGRPYVSDLARTFARVAHLRLKPTALRLPRGGAMPTVELVDTLEVGLERRQATSLGPGTITHSVHGTAEDGHHSYVYQQALDLEGSTITLFWQIAFFIEGGVPVAQTRTLTDESLFDGAFYIELRPGGGDPPWSLGACKLPQPNCYASIFTLDGQDTLTVEVCAYCPQGHLCNSTPSLMTRARFVSGGTQRDVVDPLRLAHSSRQHDWGEDLVVLFDRAAGDAHGVYLGSKRYPDHMTYESATYLDAALQAVRTVTASNPQPGSF